MKVILDCSKIADRIRQLCASSICEDMVIEYDYAIRNLLANLSFDKHEVFPNDFDAYGVTQFRLITELDRYIDQYRKHKPDLIYCELELVNIDGITAVYEIQHLD